MKQLDLVKTSKTLGLMSLLSCSTLFGQTFELHKIDESDFWENDMVHIAKVSDTEVACLNRGDSLLSVFNGSDWTFYGKNTYGFVNSGSAASELTMHPNGDFWLTHSFEVDQFDGTTTTNYANPPLDYHIVKDMAIDNDGIVYFGYSSGWGVSIKDGDTWTHRGDFTGGLSPFNDFSIIDFVETDKLSNTVWIIGGDKFYAVKDGAVTTYVGMDTPGIPFSIGGEITGMTVTADGDTWFALNSISDDPTEGGLLHFDGTTWEHINTDNSTIPSNEITAITSVGNQLILSHRFNLVIYNGADYTSYNMDNSDFPGAVSLIKELKNVGGTIYGATGSGLLEMTFDFSSTDAVTNTVTNVWFNSTSKTLNLQSENTILTVNIYTLQGDLVVSKNQLSENQLNLSQLKAGLYLVAVLNNNQKSVTKIVVP